MSFVLFCAKLLVAQKQLQRLGMHALVLHVAALSSVPVPAKHFKQNKS
jgi:hypothetical protein